MTLSERKAHWLHHIDSWRCSGLSQSAYCREHDLKSNQLSYWKRKLSAPNTEHHRTPDTQTSAFIPIHAGCADASGGLHLRLPNGCELSGIEAQHLPTVHQILKVLL